MLARKLRRAAGGASLTELTFVTSASSTTSTLAIPGTAQAGDLAIFMQRRANGSATLPNVPDGFTNIVTTTPGSNSVHGIIAYKVLVGGDPGQNLVNVLAGSAEQNIGLLIFRPNAPIAAVTPSTFNEQTTTGDPTSQNVSASGQAVPLVVLGLATTTQGGTANITTNSPAMTVVNAGNAETKMGYQIYNSAPANHAWDMSDSDSQILQSGYVVVS